MAGDGNYLYLVQDTQDSLLGNTLQIDQSLATNSSVAGSLNGFMPALQLGGGNSANITVENERATVLLNQDNSLAPSLSGNAATIFGGELAVVALEQLGSGNLGNIEVTGRGNIGSLSQTGDRNNGSVLVSGTSNSGTLNQVGNDNTYGLSVSGSATNVTFNQVGNNMTATGSPTVFSNAGTVVITQTTLSR
ncbi:MULTISPECIES: hypothetical protein [Falsihalocynthiibacter]|uniref:hypothetical protein n=1 Tax=Falsihalocynthiibacter TaxID=2854182 RepID=UPI0030012DF9